MSEYSFMGYRRPDGSVGARNLVAVMSTVVCANDVSVAIASQVLGAAALTHQQGCSQLSPDLERVTNSLIGLGCNPNAAAVLLVSLGCEGTDVERAAAEIAKTGKPVEIISIQQLGGMTNAVARGVSLAQKLALQASEIPRSRADISELTLGLKCGGSDATSGFASNLVLGYLADKIVDLGGSVVFGEVTEFIGAEHILAKRARTPQVAERIYEIVKRMETRAKSMGVDMRKGQPTPGNIAGGLTTIEEKSLGAIVKSGRRPIDGVLEYDEQLPLGMHGLWIKDSPGREPVILTGLALTRAQATAFSTGRGAPQGFPIMPVLKICGNPQTFERMQSDMDINAGLILTGGKSVELAGEEAFAALLRTLSGAATKSESLKYTNTMDIYTLGPTI